MRMEKESKIFDNWERQKPLLVATQLGLHLN